MQASKACATDMATDEFLEPGRREPDGGMYVCGHVYTRVVLACAHSTTELTELHTL